MSVDHYISLLLFMMPGSVSLYIIHSLVGYGFPRNTFDKTISYLFHTTIAYLIIQLFYIFYYKENFTYSLDTFLWVIMSAILWGALYSGLKFIFINYELTLGCAFMNSHLMTYLHRYWFKDGYVRIKLKSGEIFQGWLYAATNDFEKTKFYLTIACFRRCGKISSMKGKKYEIKPKNFDDYQIMLIDLDNIEYIQYSHERMEKIIEKKLKKMKRNDS
jgi:hypothetical protein